MTKFKSGDIVYYKDDKTKHPFLVHHKYSKRQVSLGLKEYPDTEQDFTTNISQIKHFEKNKQAKAKKKIEQILGYKI